MIAAQLDPDAGFAEWRDKARGLLGAAIPPTQVLWTHEQALFTDPLPSGHLKLNVPRAFVEMAEAAVLHDDPERFALFYRILWRLQKQRHLMQDAADPDVIKLRQLARAVWRDEHKMHAFVRFREVEGPDGPRFVSWYEPQYNVLRMGVDHFVKRFAGMLWSIVTPRASAHWDGTQLSFGPGGAEADAPPEDAREEDWRVYYENMFNPARLKVAAMLREMPKYYWRNMPETQSIQSLVRLAGVRAETMVGAEPTTPRKRAGVAHARIAPEDLPERLEPIAEQGDAPASMADLNRALKACRACPLWKDATQAVAAEGPTDEPLLALVGEQPGDQEDLAGKPFVGPAGKMLDRALEAAGIERGEIFVTNAVKHFKHEPRGRRRLHKRPDRGEVEICRWWVKHELALVKPKLVVALGVTALQSLSAHKDALSAVRGDDLETREGAPLRATIHPSMLLRLPDEADKEAEFERFVADLKAAKGAALRL